MWFIEVLSRQAASCFFCFLSVVFALVNHVMVSTFSKHLIFDLRFLKNNLKLGEVALESREALQVQ